MFCFCFFFYQGFLSRTLTTHKRVGEGADHLLFHSTTSTRSQTFRYLFATLHVRWLSHIFIRIACIYQAATWSYFTTLSNYYLIYSWCDVDFRLFSCWFDIRFCYSYLTWETGGLELTTTIILCFTSEPTNQVC